MRSEPRSARTPVWALPVPLAATPGIILIFFSSGYLDVSVHRVPPVCLLGTLVPYSAYGDGGLLRRVSPFRHPRIIAHLQLPAAFRSLSRLSSALSAKASTLCPSSLDLFTVLPFTPSVMLLGGSLPGFTAGGSHAASPPPGLSFFFFVHLPMYSSDVLSYLVFHTLILKIFSVFGFQGTCLPCWAAGRTLLRSSHHSGWFCVSHTQWA